MRALEIVNLLLNEKPSGNMVIMDMSLIGKCTSAEWNIVGIITSELKAYNALWYCDPKIKKNSSNTTAIKGLVAMGVLTRTNTTHVYIVNPRWIRKGNYDEILELTALSLRGIDKILPEHIVDLKPMNMTEICQDPVQYI